MDIEQEFENKRKAALSEMSYAQQNNILLQANLDATFETNKLLRELNEKKQTAIDNQVKFEKRWGGWKKSAVLFALLTPTLSILTGIATGVIDLSTDWPIILERVGIAFEKVSRMLG